MSLHLMLLALLPAGVSAHGRITLPVNRQGGNLAVAATSCQKYPENVNMCGYFTQNSEHPGNATICDTNLLTTHKRDVPNGGCDHMDQDHYRMSAPWRRPGTAPVMSPCGTSTGFPGGKDGRDLPKTERTPWKRGTDVDVAHSQCFNHGGGYIWRLCPAWEEQTEECFQQHSLRFAGDITRVHFVDGSEVTIPALRTTNGTFPAGSQWTMNPIPIEDAFPSPCSGCVSTQKLTQWWNFSLIDRVTLPKDLAVGDYTLSWRWDNEWQPQVWTNCADVTISDDVPPPAPAPVPTPSGLDTLVIGGVLASGDKLVSASGGVRLEMQAADGNLVLSAGDHVVWTSNTPGHGGAELHLQGDANLVLRDGKTALWSSGPPKGAVHGTVYVQLQDDCDLVTSDNIGAKLWSLGTSCESLTVTV